jgi:probable HAF family extracellular repeat protein
MHRALLSAVLSLSVLLSALASAHAAAYTFTPLDVPDAIRTMAYGINDFGQNVGNYQDVSAVTHGFLYTAGTFTSLDVPGSTVTYAQGINNRGQIVVVNIDPGLLHVEAREHNLLGARTAQFRAHIN